MSALPKRTKLKILKEMLKQLHKQSVRYNTFSLCLALEGALGSCGAVAYNWYATTNYPLHSLGFNRPLTNDGAYWWSEYNRKVRVAAINRVIKKLMA